MFLFGLVQINLLKLFLTFELSSVILGVMPILVLTSADSERNSLYTRQKKIYTAHTKCLSMDRCIRLYVILMWCIYIICLYAFVIHFIHSL